jgi:hypothetical protein
MTRDGRIREIGTLLVVAVIMASLPAATGGATEARIEVPLFTEPPIIDGVLDDEVWTTAAVVGGFTQFEPTFGEASPYHTDVLIGATTTVLFVAFRCFDSDPKRIAAAVTSRDGDLEKDDSVTLLLDTNHDLRTAYYFATNRLGVQADGKVSDNGRVVDERWDATWTCAARQTDDGWIAEFEIPFAVLRYRGGEATTWGINFHRRVPRRLETSVWSGPGESIWRISSCGTLTGLDIEATELKKFALIPYALFTAEKDRGSDTKFGGDVRFRITSALSADLTVNPDFALIEADVEEVNLTRFELEVPEKRPFFLEGLEVFDQRITQFYSRRIGDITAGGKVIGGVGGFQVAAIAARADLENSDDHPQIRDADYTVVRVQRGIFGSSTIGILAANRRVADENTGSVGADMTLFFTDTLGMTGQVLRSHGSSGDGTLGWFLRPAFDTANSHFHMRYTSLDAGLLDNVNAVGFLKDDDRREIDTEAKHLFWFHESPLENIEAKVNYNRYWSQEGVLRSWELESDVEMVFTSGWQLELSYVDEFKLYEKEFRNSLASIEVGYDDRRGRSVFLEVGSGTNYDSDLLITTLHAQYRISTALGFEYEVTWLELDPDPDLESTWIHVLRSSYYITNDLFISLFMQTNSAISKENLQLLGVWRFKPPFGALQVAYQRGTSEFGKPSEQGDTLFTKLSWVF